jgi:Leucine-rich repeat (LRR) protein
LSHNEINSQTPFSLFTTHLVLLDLSHNRFDSIPLRLFVKSVDVLKHLWMNGNQLNELEPMFFANFSSLQTVSFLFDWVYWDFYINCNIRLAKWAYFDLRL